MIRFLLFFVTALLVFSHSLNEQAKRNYFKIEGGYLVGIGNINYDDRVTFVNQSEAFRLRASFGLFLDPKTSIGIGLGLDGYHNPAHNTLPVFFELRRFLRTNNNSLFAFLNLGTAIEISQEFEKGLYFSSGLGYLINRKKIKLLPSIGINIQNIGDGRVILIDLTTNQMETIITKIALSSISFNLGIQF